MKDELGDRMKDFYEDRTRYYLPRRTYTLLRIDGKAFHTYTKGLKRPFDDDLINDMDETAAYLCKNIQGAKMAFVQSDEISILMTDFPYTDEMVTVWDKDGNIFKINKNDAKKNKNIDGWFDGNVQKIASVSASFTTTKFNQLRTKRLVEKCDSIIEALKVIDNMKLAVFDSRCWTISSKVEVMNYFVFRQKDTVRNSISSVAQSLYSHKELNGKNTDQMQEMCFQKGVNWNDFSPKYKRGRMILKETYLKNNAERTRWVSTEPPTFTQDFEYLSKLIPNI